MRIGMDYRPAMRGRTGIGRYARELAAALAAGGADLRLWGVYLRGNTPAVRRGPPGARLRAWPVPSRVADLVTSADAALGGCDVYHHTDYVLASVARAAEVMTIHDLAFLVDPSFHTERAARALDGVVREAARRCRGFLVPSEATQRDCVERLGLAPERIHTTPLGVAASFFDLPPRTPSRPYVLAVGTLEPRKNFARLIRAFGRAGLDLELRIAGKRGWRCDDVEEAAAATENVRLLGPVSDARLRELLAGCTAFAYPSLLEGFGLPVLEALAAGKPVLTSDRPPLNDLGAPVLVDPADEDALADGLRRVVAAEGAPDAARRYTWAACAAATRRAYETITA